MRHSKLRRYCAIAASTLLASSFTIHLPTDTTHLQVTDNAASARSTGARSGGGSFRSTPSRSSGSSSTGSSSSGSRSFSGNSDRGSSYQRNDRYSGGGSTVIVPVPGGPTVYSDPYRNGGYNSNGYNNSNGRSTSSGIGWIVALFFVGVSVLVVLGLVYMIYRANKGTARGGSARDRELSNNTVTVSKIQVALLAQAREIQAELTSLSLEIDTSTPDGLMLLLQESVLALLRTPENWSHVLASSQTVKSLEEAEAIFNRISIAERSKFSVETLTNVGGRVSKRDGFKPDPDEDPASYIVVTLLVGTAHDHPLFDKIQTEQALRDTLEKLASLPADYLMVFELLWSPQDASDSLTYDELLTEYTDMAQI